MKEAVVIYHRADYDGKFSGAICSFLTGTDPEDAIGWDYGDPQIDFPSAKEVYLVDLSPDCFKDIPIDATSRLIWIDHHKSSIEKWDKSLGHPFKGYRIDGVAACRLCWQWLLLKQKLIDSLPQKDHYVRRRVIEPLAVRLVGEYDVWDKRDIRADAFQYGLMLNGIDFPDIKGNLDNLICHGRPRQDPFAYREADPIAHDLVSQGEAVCKWHYEFARRICSERAYILRWEGLKFWVLASVHASNSLWFKKVPEDCNALMSWRYSGGDNVAFSLYHKEGHEDIDLSIIARKYGGGGHKGACGFMLPFVEAMTVIRSKKGEKK